MQEMLSAPVLGSYLLIYPASQKMMSTVQHSVERWVLLPSSYQACVITAADGTCKRTPLSADLGGAMTQASFQEIVLNTCRSQGALNKDLLDCPPQTHWCPRGGHHLPSPLGVEDECGTVLQQVCTVETLVPPPPWLTLCVQVPAGALAYRGLGEPRGGGGQQGGATRGCMRPSSWTLPGRGCMGTTEGKAYSCANPAH